MNSPAPSMPPEIEKLTDPQVQDPGIPGKAKFVTPVKITLKEANNFPSRHPYPPLSLCSFVISPLTTPTLTVLLAVHTSIAPAYKHPPSDTMNAIAKVTNSSDC